MSVVAFLSPHLNALQDLFELRVMANTTEAELLRSRGLNISIEFAPVERPIRPCTDLKALWWLYKQFRANKPAVVHTLTPKAGLLGMLAAWLAKVPVRVHTFTGQVWVTRKGPMRWLLQVADKSIAALATDVLVDSPSQRDFLIDQHVVKVEKSAVLGAGSICGVNTRRFCPDSIVRSALRRELGVADDAVVLLYLGRLNKDKGVLDLAAAFAQVAPTHPKAVLWVVGPDEENMFADMQRMFSDFNNRVFRVGFTPEPERFMKSADMFCLPSYREGFGSSVIEAASCGIPAVTSRIYGLTDAVVEGKTGWMHNPGDVADLSSVLNSVLSCPDEMRLRGVASRQIACNVFEESRITGAMLDFYQAKIKS